MDNVGLAGRLGNGVFRELWNNYRMKVEEVPRVEDALRSLGEVWHEDHVAFRTLPGEHCGSHVLEGLFRLMGYRRRDNYVFRDKRLKAFWMEPPTEPSTPAHLVLPKVFISELELKDFSPEFRACIQKYTSQLETSPLLEWRRAEEELKRADYPTHPAANDSVRLLETLKTSLVSYLGNGPAWKRPSFTDYQMLLRESEYAAWTLVFGAVPNHFTVSVHLMKRFASLEQFNEFLINKLAVAMNDSGGKIIKGSASVQLEQSATLAHKIPVLFQEGVRLLPYAFVEFAFRYPHEGMPADGLWGSYYQGFVTDNADKIFESTNVVSRQP
ncbi:MAG: DUF1338 domain-containing protein [Betaproteobacteria bacterium]|nr:DUF1338 domain-containing protein [Betaproteobacteria bacterium]